MINKMRLDAAESAFFERELEAIDSQVYGKIYKPMKSRIVIPTQPGIPEWAHEYTWREMTEYGSAEFISNAADDLPRADVEGTETTKLIKLLGSSYGYDIREIKAAAALGRPLDRMRADACRLVVEKKVDLTLASGSTPHNLEGFLNLSNASSYTLSTKTAGGLTWGTLAAPNATADEVVADLTGIAAHAYVNSGEAFDTWDIVLPVEQYTYASQVRLGDTQMTALRFAMETSPYIDRITPWDRCDNAGAGGTTDRMVCYVRRPDVVAGIVPMEFQTLPFQQRNLKYIVPAMASCGGCLLRYDFGVVYADGL